MADPPPPPKRTTARPAGRTPPAPAPRAAPRPQPPPAAPPSPPAAPRASAPPRRPLRAARTFSLYPGPGNAWPLFAAALRNVLAARKTVLLFLLMLLPLYITWIIHGAVGMEDYEYNDDWGGAPPGASPGLLWFQDASFGILFPFLIPLTVAVFAASTIGEEVEGKTLPYLFTRPVYRNWILLTKGLGVLLGVFVVGAAALTLFWFGSVSLTQSPLEDLGQLLGHLWVLVLTVFAAGGLFLLLGVLWRRSIIVIVLYLFVWEFFFSQAPALFFKRASLANYERPILLAVTDRTLSLDDISLGFVSAATAHVVLLALGVVGLLAALYTVSNKDYNV